MTRVGILVFDGMTLLDLSGPAEVLSRAPGYEITLFSPTGGTVTAGNGLQVTGCVAPVSSGLDTVIITGADALPGGWDPALLHACSTLATGARRVASICTGAFLLAELGLLDGRRATTHWRNARDLARRYPRVRVEADTLHVHDGKYLTSAGITAGIDLALSLVEEDHGAAEARHIAQDMVVFMHRPGGQSQFADAASTVVDHPILRSVVESVHADPTGAHTVTSLAESAATSGASSATNWAPPPPSGSNSSACPPPSNSSSTATPSPLPPATPASAATRPSAAPSNAASTSPPPNTGPASALPSGHEYCYVGACTQPRQLEGSTHDYP